MDDIDTLTVKLEAMTPEQRAEVKAKFREDMAEADRAAAAKAVAEAYAGAESALEVQAVQARTIAQAVSTLGSMQRQLAGNLDTLGIPFKPLDLSYVLELVELAGKQIEQVSAKIVQKRAAA